MEGLGHAYAKVTPDPPRRAIVAQPFEVQVSNFGLCSERKLMSYKMAVNERAALTAIGMTHTKEP